MIRLISKTHSILNIFQNSLMRVSIYWIWWLLPHSISLWILFVSHFSPNSCSPDVSLNFSSKDNKIILKKSMGRLKASCEYKFCAQRVEKSWNSLLNLKFHIEFSIMSATEKANKISKKNLQAIAKISVKSAQSFAFELMQKMFCAHRFGFHALLLISSKKTEQEKNESEKIFWAGKRERVRDNFASSRAKKMSLLWARKFHHLFSIPPLDDENFVLQILSSSDAFQCLKGEKNLEIPVELKDFSLSLSFSKREYVQVSQSADDEYVDESWEFARELSCDVYRTLPWERHWEILESHCHRVSSSMSPTRHLALTLFLLRCAKAVRALARRSILHILRCCCRRCCSSHTKSNEQFVELCAVRRLARSERCSILCALGVYKI